MNRDSNDYYSDETPRSGMPPADDLPEIPLDEEVTPAHPMRPVTDWDATPARPMRPVDVEAGAPRRSKARDRIEKRKQ